MKPKVPPSVSMTVYVPVEDASALDQIAREAGVPLSTAFRVALARGRVGLTAADLPLQGRRRRTFLEAAE